VKDLKVVNWTENPDVQNAMRNRMDDYFFDVVRDEHGVQLEPDQIDVIVDSVLKVARARMAA
jgi:type I restriction enzyme R subunit